MRLPHCDAGVRDWFCVRVMVLHSAVTSAVLAVCAGAAWAQNEPGKELFPTREEPPAIAPREKQETQVSPSIKLSATALPADFELPRATTLTEASAIARVTGTLVRVKDQFFFVPDAGQKAGENGPAVPGLVLLPNQRLEQMAAGLVSRGDRAAGVLTAQVFNYRGRAHALVMQFAFAVAEDAGTGEPSPRPVAPSEPAEAPAQQRPVAPASDDDVAAIVRDLQNAAERPRALSRPDVQVINDIKSARGAEVETPTPVSERTVLVRKRGRLVRLASAEGRFAFAFDNDPDSPAPAPMLLHPCAMLQAIEDVAGEHGDGLTFEITGRVTRFGDRNYVLPEFFQVVRQPDPRGTDLRSRQ